MKRSHALIYYTTNDAKIVKTIFTVHGCTNEAAPHSSTGKLISCFNSPSLAHQGPQSRNENVACPLFLENESFHHVAF